MPDLGNPRHGCHNAERKPGYWLMQRHYSGERFVMQETFIADRGSTDCRFDTRATDPRCVGCKKVNFFNHEGEANGN